MAMKKGGGKEEEPQDAMNDQAEKSEEGRTMNACPFCLAMEALALKKKEYAKFFGHLRNAEVEVLKGFRSILDARIEECEKEPKPRKATKIKVE